MKKIIPYSPCLLLLSLFLNQVYFSKYKGLSPWKGGGFGMFALYEERFLTCRGETYEGERVNCKIATYTDATASDREFITSNLIASIFNYPSEDKLRGLADHLFSSRFYWSDEETLSYVPQDQLIFNIQILGDKAVARHNREANVPGIFLRSINLQVWKKTMDFKSMKLNYSLVEEGKFYARK